jgi:hypothetical protein
MKVILKWPSALNRRSANTPWPERRAPRNPSRTRTSMASTASAVTATCCRAAWRWAGFDVSSAKNTWRNAVDVGNWLLLFVWAGGMFSGVALTLFVAHQAEYDDANKS